MVIVKMLAVLNVFSCHEDCDNGCDHRTCKKKCSDLCELDPCNKRCENKLICGHQCIGLCGEKCPKLCRIFSKGR